VVEEYLLARRDWGWPAGRAGAWALGEVVDRHQTLAMTAIARGEDDTAFAVQMEQRLEQRTRAARVAWADQATEPWLRCDVRSLPVAQAQSHSIPTERARSVSTAELHGWVEEALRPDRLLELAVDGARTAAARTRHHRGEEQLVLHGLRRQLQETGPWWWPGSWGRRAELNARIQQRQQVVVGLGEQVRRAEEQVAARMVDLKTRQVYRDWLVGRAVAAVQELQLREQGLLDDREVDPPGHPLETLGSPPSDVAGRQAWKAQVLQLERTRAQGQAIDSAARAASGVAAGVAPPALAASDQDRAGAGERIAARDAAGWPLDPAVRDHAVSGEPLDDLRPAEPPRRLDVMTRRHWSRTTRWTASFAHSAASWPRTSPHG